MATYRTRFTHTRPPQGFIRKYVFSLDHKVIGIQYYFLALTAVFVGMFLSLLMRIHLIWPQAVLAFDRRDQAGNLSQPAHHARHHHGVLCADHGAAGRLRQLLPAHPDRRADMAFPVLNMLSFWTTLRRLHRDDLPRSSSTGGAPLHGWTGYAPLSALQIRRAG